MVVLDRGCGGRGCGGDWNRARARARDEEGRGGRRHERRALTDTVMGARLERGTIAIAVAAAVSVGCTACRQEFTKATGVVVELDSDLGADELRAIDVAI